MTQTQVVGRVEIRIRFCMEDTEVGSNKGVTGDVLGCKETEGSGCGVSGEVATGGMEGFGMPRCLSIDAMDDEWHLVLY